LEPPQEGETEEIDPVHPVLRIILQRSQRKKKPSKWRRRELLGIFLQWSVM
jgi:hypothetical protein